MPYPGYNEDYGNGQPGCLVYVIGLIVLIVIFVLLKSCVMGG